MTKIVVLAAGKGRRMGRNIPKVLIPLSGKPIIEYLVESIKQSAVCDKPVVIVAPDNKDSIEQALNGCDYVMQEKQLGTGHAVACTKDFLQNEANNILVLYGDMPFISGETIKKLSQTHLEEEKVLTMATVKISNLNNWAGVFRDFGRIIRGENGQIRKIVEKKDATKGELEIKEINPSYFCFQASWLWQNINGLKNNNQQKEYYLTDLVQMAIDQGEKIASIEIEPHECLGINTPEQLQLAKKLLN